MRLFLDECLSPQLAINLSKEGEHLVVHPRNNGGLGAADHEVLERCTKENPIIVTENAREFRALAARADIHPGIILLPCVARETSERLLRVAIAHLEKTGNSDDVLINHILEVAIDEMVEIFALPKA